MFKIMKKLVASAAIMLPAAMAIPATASAASTVKLLVMQEDWDKASLPRNSRIQNAILNTLNQTLHAPAYQSIINRYGIQGMDVYSETAVTLPFYKQDRTRRRDEELISLARAVNNPTIDVLTMYTVYARAVPDPYTQISRLQIALNYRALDVKSGRYLGGGNLDVNTNGIVVTGCAAGLNYQKPDPHCVAEFVSRHAERLAQDAGNKLALQLSALLGRAYGKPGPVGRPGQHAKGGPIAPPAIVPGAEGVPGPGPRSSAYAGGKRHPGCNSLPTNFLVTYKGFSQRQINFIEGNMANWKCALDLDTASSSFSGIQYEYKTTANQQRIVRNIRLMLELLGIVGEPKTNGTNEIIVSALTLREN